MSDGEYEIPKGARGERMRALMRVPVDGTDGAMYPALIREVRAVLRAEAMDHRVAYDLARPPAQQDAKALIGLRVDVEKTPSTMGAHLAALAVDYHTLMTRNDSTPPQTTPTPLIRRTIAKSRCACGCWIHAVPEETTQ